MPTSSIQEVASYSRPAYRPDIDGLRALAISSVLVFHAFPSSLRGGFVGVDIFFVISGFLISSIIFRGLEEDRFSFSEFYAHRARRIFPALILVLGATAAFGWFALLPDEFKQLGKHLAASTAFLQNMALWSEAGYFDTASELKPLMHLWSLAIEEQFYLIYPLVIWGAWRLRLNVLTTVVLLGALSFALNIKGLDKDAIRTFYVPQTRFWELLAGSLLAYVHLFKQRQCLTVLKRILFTGSVLRHPSAPGDDDRYLKNLLSLSGLALLLASVTCIRAERPFPGWWALAPVTGAFLVILGGKESWGNRKLLSHPLMVFIGTISYPLYLWHWPLLSFAKILNAETPSAAVRAFALVVSFVLAWMTYRLVERPIRFGPKTATRTAALCLALACIGGLGALVSRLEGVPDRIPSQVRALMNHPEPDWFTRVRGDVCHLQAPLANKHADLCLETGKPSIMLWGDSHAASLYMGLRHLQQTSDLGLIQLTQAGCGPVFDLPVLLYKKNCNELNRALLGTATAVQPDILILHGAWKHRDWPIEPNELTEKLGQTLGILKAALPHTRIIVIGPVPQWKLPLNKIMYSYWRQRSPHRYPGQYMTWGLIPEIPLYDAAVRASARAQGISYISAYDIMCPTDGCMARMSPQTSSKLTYADDGHLTSAGSIFLVDAMRQSILGH